MILRVQNLHPHMVMDLQRFHHFFKNWRDLRWVYKSLTFPLVKQHGLNFWMYLTTCFACFTIFGVTPCLFPSELKVTQGRLKVYRSQRKASSNLSKSLADTSLNIVCGLNFASMTALQLADTSEQKTNRWGIFMFANARLGTSIPEKSDATLIHAAMCT